MRLIKVRGVYYSSPDYKLAKNESYINLDRIDEITVSDVDQFEEVKVYSVRMGSDIYSVISKALDELILEAR